MKNIILAKLLLMFSCALIAAENIKKPIPVCSNIQPITAYKMATSFADQCRAHGVFLNLAKAKSKMQKMVSEDNEWTPGTCNRDCLLASAANNMDMSACVERLSDKFVEGMLEPINFSKENCLGIKKQFEQ